MKLTHTVPLLQVAQDLNEVLTIRQALRVRNQPENRLDRAPVTYSPRLVSTWGLAYSTKNGLPCKITLRLELLRPELRSHHRVTFLHEVAHLIANLTCPNEGHGPIWRATARLLGIQAERCVSARASNAMREVTRTNLTVNFDEEL